MACAGGDKFTMSLPSAHSGMKGSKIMKTAKRFLHEGKVALVTGGARGLGLAQAARLVREGARVAICDVQEDLLKTAAGELNRLVPRRLQKQGLEVLAVVCNITSSDDVKKMVATIVGKWGRIDILVNNAGITRDSSLLKMTDESWEQVINVNLTGTMKVIREVLPVMRQQNSGAIINISSVVALMGNFGQANYVSTKAGVIGLTRVVALEQAKYGITCNAVAPGFIATEMTKAMPPDVLAKKVDQVPLKRIGEPDDVAAAVNFLAGPDAAYITGFVLSVNGGLYM